MKISYDLKIASRALLSQKIISLINLIGLTIGFACFSLFLLYSLNEFNYDKFNKNEKSIYRIYEYTQNLPGSPSHGDAGLYLPLGPALVENLKDVENYVRVQKSWDEKFVKAEETTIRSSVTFVDSQFFNIFSFKLLFGNRDHAFKNSRNVVITKDKAIQLFRQTNVVGKILQIKIDDKFEPFIVSAVTENVHSNSSIQFNILLNFDYFQTTGAGKIATNNWNFTGFENYVQLKKGSNLPNERLLLSKFREKYFPDEKEKLKQWSGWDGSDPYPVSFKFQPLSDIHTNPEISANGQSGIDLIYIWILLGIATIVLVIACINFTTLSIGRATARTKEIFVRKVIGSSRKKIVLQLLTETFLLSFCAGMLGLTLSFFLLPSFNTLAGTRLQFSYLLSPELIWIFLSLLLIVSILAGGYPALVLSGFKPMEILRSKLRLGGSNLFAKLLVIFQFTLSMSIIISTVIVVQQINYMSSKNLGFSKENVVVIDADGAEVNKVYPLIKQSLSGNSQVLGITCSDIGLGEEGFNSKGFEYNGKHEQIYESLIGADYINVMGIKLVAGRNFDSRISSDTIGSIIVNEALVKDLGLKNEQIIGLKLDGLSAKKSAPPVIIGVVQNFNFLSLRQKISPFVFREPSDILPSKIFVRISPGKSSQVLATLKKTWNNIVPDIPLQYNFLDEKLNSFYRNEIILGSILRWAGGIAVFLACLGLFGLAALSTINRVKEIGIRRVIGASITSIVLLLSKDFLKLIMISLIIASPVAWLFVNRWLQNYAFRIEIQLWVFVLTGFLMLVLAFLTVGYHTIKTANTNPTKALRRE
jgi:putative ABC transport system permease protein